MQVVTLFHEIYKNLQFTVPVFSSYLQMASSDPDGVVDTLTALTVLPDRGGKTRYAFELSGNSAGPSSPPLYTYTRARSFGVLVERALSSVCHSKEVMLLQIASYIVIAMLVGMYSHSHDIGNDAAKVLKNVGCIFFTILFAVLIGTMPTILTCMRDLSWHFFFEFRMCDRLSDNIFVVL